MPCWTYSPSRGLCEFLALFDTDFCLFYKKNHMVKNLYSIESLSKSLLKNNKFSRLSYSPHTNCQITVKVWKDWVLLYFLFAWLKWSFNAYFVTRGILQTLIFSSSKIDNNHSILMKAFMIKQDRFQTGVAKLVSEIIVLRSFYFIYLILFYFILFSIHLFNYTSLYVFHQLR